MIARDRDSEAAAWAFSTVLRVILWFSGRSVATPNYK